MYSPNSVDDSYFYLNGTITNKEWRSESNNDNKTSVSTKRSSYALRGTVSTWRTIQLKIEAVRKLAALEADFSTWKKANFMKYNYATEILQCIFEKFGTVC